MTSPMARNLPACLPQATRSTYCTPQRRTVGVVLGGLALACLTAILGLFGLAPLAHADPGKTCTPYVGELRAPCL